MNRLSYLGAFMSLAFMNLVFANLAFMNLAFANLAFMNLAFVNLAFVNLAFVNLASVNVAFAQNVMTLGMFQMLLCASLLSQCGGCMFWMQKNYQNISKA